MLLMRARLVLLLVLFSLLGVRMSGLHLHVLDQTQSDTVAAVHLAQFAEDGDADHAVELDPVGKNLTHSLLLLPIGGGLLLLLLLLPLPANVRLPRAPVRCGRCIDPRHRTRPPSQAPPR